VRLAHQLFVIALATATACGRFGFESTQDQADSGSGGDADGVVELVIGEASGAMSGRIVDSTIKDYDATINFEEAGFIGAFAPLNGIDSTPGLVRFDLSGLSSFAVESAVLQVSINPNVDDEFSGETIAAARLLEAWVADEVTYVERSAGLEWSAPGAGGDARGAIIGDVETEPGSTVAELTLAPAAVQQWVDTPNANNGFILVVLADDGSGSWLASSDFSEPSRRPIMRLRGVE